MSMNGPRGTQELLTERVLICFAFVVSLMLFSATAGHPFHLDNMDFPAVAKATSETGLPLYYRGEENPHLLGLYHPPLYIYLLAGWIRLFGFGEVQIRLFGFVCLLVQFWLAFRIMALLFGRQIVRPWVPFILLAFLPHAYTLQAASIVDIDTTIYGPILLAVLYFTLSLSWRDGVWHGEEVTAARLLRDRRSAVDRPVGETDNVTPDVSRSAAAPVRRSYGGERPCYAPWRRALAGF